MNRIDAKTSTKEKERGREIEKLINGKLTGSGYQRRARSNVARRASRMSQQHHKIARELNVQVLQVYRLREKISSHAIRVFAFKIQPELVATRRADFPNRTQPGEGTGTVAAILPQPDAGAAPAWQLKAGLPVEAIAKTLKLKPTQVAGEWSKLYARRTDSARQRTGTRPFLA